MRSFEEAMEWIENLQKFGIKPGLERMNWMLERLGHPQRRLKFIHLAGTNGKGSTLQYISSVLQTAGYEVGSFSSPAIDTFTSRIQVNGQPIPDEIFVELVAKLKPLAERLETSVWGPPTEFEVTTMIALLYFSTKAFPDFVVWEAGLGGRLDSTNVVFPIVSVITNIGLDHTDILGSDKQQIAFEKAGIIKNGFPVVTGETDPECLATLKEIAQTKKSKVYALNEHFEATRKTSTYSRLEEKFDFKGPFADYSDLRISLIGEHQIWNAGLAVMTLELLRQYYAAHFELDHLREGLRRVQWPGRIEVIHNDPYVILDGAHNVESVDALREVLRERFPDQKVVVLFSALRDKNVKGIINRLAPICDEAFVASVEHPRAADPSMIERLFLESNPNLSVRTIPDQSECVDAWMRAGGAQSVLLATGSLYLISNIRPIIQQKVGDER